MHVYDFITDHEQYSLKRGSRVFDKDEPFETVLSTYSQLFMQEFDQLSAIEEPKHLNEPMKSSPDMQAWFAHFLHLIQTDKRNILTLFSDLEGIYLIFLEGKHQTAVALLHHFLEKYDLLDNVFYEMLGCFFRGRIIHGGDDYMDEAYYKHIPFNKRYLIKNQRFSFSGIPLLYAGESLIATYFELGKEDLDDKSIGIATFNYDHLAYVHLDNQWQPVRSRNKIFDITNSIYDVINDLFYDVLESGRKIGQFGDPAYPAASIKRAFRKFILSQLCTFPRKHHLADQHFVEEYVLPQLLTEAVRQHKYDGIIYPSTRFIGKKIEFGKGWHNSIFKANLAMFTTYTLGSHYDEALLHTVVPHVIDLTGVENQNAKEDLDLLKQALASLEQFLYGLCNSEVRGRFIIQLRHFDKKIKTYESLTINDRPYLDTYAGKVEAAYMKEYFKYIRTLVMRVYPDEYEKMIEEWNKDSSQ